MIEQGRVQGWLRLPITSLPTWANLHGVQFYDTGIELIANRGAALVATTTLRASDNAPLLRVPRDLILSLESVQLHAKADRDLRALLDAAGDFGRVGEYSPLPGSRVFTDALSYVMCDCHSPSVRCFHLCAK